MDICVSIYLTVRDEQAFRQAAHDRALEDGLDETMAKQHLNAAASSLRDCEIMLLDPGVSPKGCEILDSTAE